MKLTIGYVIIILVLLLSFLIFGMLVESVSNLPESRVCKDKGYNYIDRTFFLSSYYNGSVVKMRCGNDIIYYLDRICVKYNEWKEECDEYKYTLIK